MGIPPTSAAGGVGAGRPPTPWTGRLPSATFPPAVIEEIQMMAEEGRYEIRGWGAKRAVPCFDDLVFLTGSLSRYPLEGYRERCETKTVLGTRFASRPLELEIPITIAGMSFGALSANAKEALGRAARAVGTSTTTGDGGMTPEERRSSKLLVYQCLPSRYGFNLDDLLAADAIEVVVGQGAKPGGGGMLLGQKVSARVAAMRSLPPGIDQRSASRHPDWTGPDDLRIKIEELREATGWEKPVYVKFGATRVDHDVKLAVAAGADVVVVDGMQGGTGATQTVFIEHAGIPTLPAVRMAAEALREIGKQGEVQLVVSGGIRSGGDVAKALALGADAVSIGVASLVALGCNSPAYRVGGREIDATDGYAALGTMPGYCHHCETGCCPVGITTQDPDLEARLDPELAATRVTNYLRALTMELTAIARACGKSNVHNLEPDDLAALTIEAAAMARVPLAGTGWNPGRFAGMTELADDDRRETVGDAEQVLRERLDSDEVEFVLAMFVDLHGKPCAKMVPVEALDVLLDGGAGFAGFAAGPMGQTPADPDLVAVPDPASYTPVPWQHGLAVLQCDLHVEGRPWPYSPRVILRRAVGQAAARGLAYKVGVEAEYFLVRRLADGAIEVADPLDRADSPCYDAKGIMRMYEHLTRVSRYVNQLGWSNYANDHEDANGQFEQNFQYADAVTSADRLVFFRFMVHALAHEAGMAATFMPKPFTHLTGNGLHLHSSLWDGETGAELFADESDPRGLGLSEMGYWYVGGLVEHARSLVAVTCPIVNSYKRMGVGAPSSGSTWAPAYATFGGNNRTQMLRVPAGGRIENRACDGAANPYLAMTVQLAAGLDGIDRKLSPGEPNTDNLYELEPDEVAARGIRSMPPTLLHAVDELVSDPVLRAGLGTTAHGDYVDYYARVKREEFLAWHAHVSEWELDRYLTLF